MDGSKQLTSRRTETDDIKTLRRRIEDLEKEKYILNKKLEEADSALTEKVE